MHLSFNNISDSLKNQILELQSPPTSIHGMNSPPISIHGMNGMNGMHLLKSNQSVLHLDIINPKTSTTSKNNNPDLLIKSQSQSPIEKKGLLKCKGEYVDSEVIYWKIHEGDAEYESPITPHHGIHDDRYFSFEYDHGGWNNGRMSYECFAVLAHAMGRTLVLPPRQHLYLLSNKHKDEEDAKAHDDMGFEDFYEVPLLKSHKGFKVLTMKEFLAAEGLTGGLHGKLPPGNSTDAWGRELWKYFNEVGDAFPIWGGGRFVAMPSKAGVNFSMDGVNNNSLTNEEYRRMQEFAEGRRPVFYNDDLQKVHHLHFRGDDPHRLVFHFYGFIFFADLSMQNYYKRFIRDYMRYTDKIHCTASEVLSKVREKAAILDPSRDGSFYALHVRRGDFQFKDVKLSASEIVKNMHFPNGSSVIPKGAVVFLSTDDPNGLCKDCLVQRKPCEGYPVPKPVGCPEDTSWNAFRDAGWQVLLLRDFVNEDHFQHVNSNIFGMIEIIICSRAIAFAGTYMSSFTGYIHRLRGYHGLDGSSYFHSNGRLLEFEKSKFRGHGFIREFRSGWSYENGEHI